MNDVERHKQWIAASFRSARFEAFMISTVQGLGNIDRELIRGDSRFLALTEEQRSTVPEGILLTDRITLSYLWVLGAYEVIRSIDQRMREKDGASTATSLKRDFERIRVPLAKFEPARRHAATDSRIAYPALNLDHGCAWQITENTFITRRELADKFLEFLLTLDTPGVT